MGWQDRIKHIHAWHGLHHHHFKQKLGLELPDEDETRHKTSFETATGPPGSVLSPMAGLVVKVLANDGTKVEEGQPILVLEAMKMEVVFFLQFCIFLSCYPKSLIQFILYNFYSM